jgi:large subunit ribosomal protein L21
MYAVIQTGGKQYRVQAGDVIKVEQLSADVGSTFTFKEVLMIAKEGQIECQPAKLKSASVDAEIVSQGRHKKIKIIKFRRRKHHMKQMGHRQNFTEVQIKAIHA